MEFFLTAVQAIAAIVGKKILEMLMVIRLLNRRFSQISPNLLTQIRGLSVEQLEDLGEALLDFQSEEDLKQWFNNGQWTMDN
ncbi:MAG: DUF4351 domain-containing protein [Crocosphaera sp.]